MQLPSIYPVSFSWFVLMDVLFFVLVRYQNQYEGWAIVQIIWTSVFLSLFADDVDLRSISDQIKTKEHWEKQIATGDVSLFPKQPELPKSRTLNDLTDFKSEVETESIADLAKTKQRWESLSISDENILQSTSPKVKSYNNSPWSAGVPSKSNGQSPAVKSASESSFQSYNTSLPTLNSTDEDVYLNSNSYDEKSLTSSETAKKDETQEKNTMPITKVPPPSKANFRPTPNVRVPPSATAPIVNASSAQSAQNSRPEYRQSESIIDREIREQQEREQEMKIRLANSSDKVSRVCLLYFRYFF